MAALAGFEGGDGTAFASGSPERVARAMESAVLDQLEARLRVELVSSMRSDLERAVEDNVRGCLEREAAALEDRWNEENAELRRGFNGEIAALRCRLDNECSEASMALQEMEMRLRGQDVGTRGTQFEEHAFVAVAEAEKLAREQHQASVQDMLAHERKARAAEQEDRRRRDELVAERLNDLERTTCIFDGLVRSERAERAAQIRRLEQVLENELVATQPAASAAADEVPPHGMLPSRPPLPPLPTAPVVAHYISPTPSEGVLTTPALDSQCLTPRNRPTQESHPQSRRVSATPAGASDERSVTASTPRTAKIVASSTSPAVVRYMPQAVAGGSSSSSTCPATASREHTPQRRAADAVAAREQAALPAASLRYPAGAAALALPAPSPHPGVATGSVGAPHPPSMVLLDAAGQRACLEGHMPAPQVFPAPAGTVVLRPPTELTPPRPRHLQLHAAAREPCTTTM